MLPFIQIGPALLQLPGLILLAGVWAGLNVSEKAASRVSLSPAALHNLVFYGLLAGLLGARLTYALRHLNAYLIDPLGLFALTPSTLLIEGGLLIGALTALLYGRRQRLPLRPSLDALAPGLALFMIAVHLANLASGDAFGAPADLPWAIELWGARRHPSQIYEALAALVIFGLVRKRPDGSGVTFLLLAALSAAARVFLEAFRGDSAVGFADLRAAQVLGLVVLALALWWLPRWVFAHEVSQHGV